MSFDKRIDQYIEKSQPFAKEILEHLRALVHKGCPEADETIKWGFPHFEYAGEILCSMASFKAHCSFGFWKATLLEDQEKLLSTVGKTAMGHLGRIKTLEDLPSDQILLKFIKEATRLNKEGIKLPPKPKVTAGSTVETPDYVEKALKKNKKAWSVFENLSPSNKKEYIEWITEAKTEATRTKRLETAVEWISEGKIRHWKYAK